MSFQGKVLNKIKLNLDADGLASGKILVGDSNSIAQPVTPSGDVTVSTAGVMTIGDDKIGNAELADTHIQYAETTITNAQLIALRAAPINLVAAPGAGKFLEFISAVIKLNAGTEVLTETGDNLVIQYDGGTDASAAIESTGFIDQAVDTIAVIKGASIATVAASAVENDALELFNTGDGEIAGNATGDATLTVGVSYRVHTL